MAAGTRREHSRRRAVGADGTHLWWRLLVAPFTYTNTGYAIVALGTIAVYGWLLERRHGPAVVLVLFAIAAVGGAALTSVDSTLPVALGANGGALALLIAWAIPDLLSLRAGEDIDGDLLGTAVVAAVVALMPLAAPGASWVCAGVGVVAGIWSGCRSRWPANAERPRRRPRPPGRRMINDAPWSIAPTPTPSWRLRSQRSPIQSGCARRRRSSRAPRRRSRRVLAAALDEGGWFDNAHSQAVREATGQDEHSERVRAVETMLAEETRLGMLVGVAVGFELARELGAPRLQTKEED